MNALPSELRTGVETVDSEHERLFALLEKSFKACKYPNDLGCSDCPEPPSQCHTKAFHLLDELVFNIMTHFLNEEKHMGCLERHEAEAHKHDHADISASLVKLSKDAEADEVKLTPRIIKQTVLSYLEQHVVGYDHLLASRLNTANI